MTIHQKLIELEQSPKVKNSPKSQKFTHVRRALSRSDGMSEISETSYSSYSDLFQQLCTETLSTTMSGFPRNCIVGWQTPRNFARAEMARRKGRIA